MKKVLKIILCIILAIVIIAAAYVAYVFIAYHRLGDNIKLEVQGKAGQNAIDVGTEQKIVSWNIGFGAYEDDYGFFMDGGTQSWAWSKERLTANLDAISARLTTSTARPTLLAALTL